jgi:hypothetical protein
MGILKLTPQEIQSLNHTPKDLSDLWKRYFSNLSVNLTKLFFKYSHESFSVRYLHRDVIKVYDYLNSLDHQCVLKPFKINNGEGLGFVLLSTDLSNYLINSLLGSDSDHYGQGHILTSVDQKLLNNVLVDMTKIIEMQMINDHKHIVFNNMGTTDLEFLKFTHKGHELISVQQFLLVSGQHSYVFDIAFSNKLLENYVLT